MYSIRKGNPHGTACNIADETPDEKARGEAKHLMKGRRVIMKATYFILAMGAWLVGTTALRAQEPEITVELPGGATMEMVWIPPGTFLIGSPEDEPGRLENEGPKHEVTISRGFYLSKYELTQEQWESVMDTRPWEGKSHIKQAPNYPAEWISWEAGQAFIHRLNKAAGDSLYRMPTEAEWEYACRAGTTTPWSFGDEDERLGAYAWFKGTTSDVGEWYAHEVGQKLPNPWGLHDMHCNVEEWVQDWAIRGYTTEPQVDPVQTEPTGRIDPESVNKFGRMARGGFRLSNASGCRSANRWIETALYEPTNLMGIRLLRRVGKATVIPPSSWGDVKYKPFDP